MDTPLPCLALMPATGLPPVADVGTVWELPLADEHMLRPVAPAALATWLAQQGFPGLWARGENGETPLMRAAGRGEDAAVAALLSCGAAPDALDDDGNCALWFACLHGGPATVRRLIEAGAPIDHANDEGITCLLQAAASGRVDVLRLLLDQGAATDSCAPDGRYALDLAADLGRQLLRLARRLDTPVP